MTGQHGWKYCSNKTDPQNPKHYLYCIKNVAEVIDNNGPYDFVFLQEASNYKKIIEISDILKTMHFFEHKSGNEEMVIFWNKKYHLNPSLAFIGEFSKGRPFQVASFTIEKNNKYSYTLIVINIHAEHLNLHVLTKKLNKMLQNIRNSKPFKENNLHDMSSSNRYIIAGDFNTILNTTVVLDNIMFYNTDKILLTCCGPKYKYSFDHIIDSKAPPSETFSPTVNSPASDHLPIISILEPI